MSTKKKTIVIVTTILGVVVLAAVLAVLIVYFNKKKTDNSSLNRISIPLKKMLFVKNVSVSHNFSEIIDGAIEVEIPHTWNAFDGQSQADYAMVPSSYQQYIQIGEKYQNKNVYIDFCGVNLKTTVYIDGKEIGRHVGGYAAFRFDITQYVTFGGENLLSIVADNSNNMEYYPCFADYTFMGGIYRNVQIIIAEKTSFRMDDRASQAFYIKPSVNLTDKVGTVEMNVSVTKSDENVKPQIKFTIFDQEKNEIFTETSESQKVQTVLENVHLWDGKVSPYLYTALAELIVDGKTVDTVESHFGFRTVVVNHTGFFLNGRKMQLRGVSRHQDREDKGWAISNEDEIEDFEIIDELGANAVRLAHYQQNQTIYDICDQKGIVIICEIPFISVFLNSTKSSDNLKEQLVEMIKQNFNHPCVAMWGVMNEVGMRGESEEEYQLVRELNQLVKELDNTRITYGAMMLSTPADSTLNILTDVIGYNLYGGWYIGDFSLNCYLIDLIRNISANGPLSLTEYGAEANLKYHSDNPVSHDYSEEYQTLFHIETYKIIQEKDLWGSFVWNMFDFASGIRDEGGVKGRNNKGLVTFDRKTKKDSFYFYKAMWNTTHPFVHICSKRFHDRATDDINVTIFTNLVGDECTLKLSVNGKQLKTVEKYNEKVGVFNINLENGTNKVDVEVSSTKSTVKDSAEFEKVAEPNPEYDFINKTDEEAKYPHPDGYYSVFDTIGEVHENEEAWTIFNSVFDGMMGDLEAFLPFIKNQRVLDLLQIAGSLIPDDVIIGINAKLNKIPKKK
ncbi:beta-galactosidase [Tritrichomonas foetus]|uniref:Beta-galactosidase n=1 Tax=Tritrichomonas foetus TaxID=1144522 RepID=A0A1J4J9R5_9EUKA|nr:beta-galactosidase [Tritrichomonas foetus]|eukprot:OHS95896.1 beta-galactosidase [Tritrichomonas foetus]